jgi:hypothetical protein
MNTLSKISPLRVISTKAVRKGSSPRSNQIIVTRRDAVNTTDGLKMAGYIAAGLALAAVVGVYVYRRSQQKTPMTRLQHLKAQLGLTEADFKDLKTKLSKLDANQLRELNKAAW